MPADSLPVVAIIGRPNVGKSALFNRLVQKRQSLVDATPGLTRDRLYGDVQWRGSSFRVVDTGGLQFGHTDKIQQAIASQVEKAMQEAHMALLVCDARQGLTPLDKEVANWARRWSKPVLVIANKVDTERDAPSAAEISALGLGNPWSISSLHGLGIGDLLDAIVDKLSLADLSGAAPSEGTVLRVAIIGRPNVGKSSLINRILNEERVLVNDQPGTTRDPVEIPFSYKGRHFCLIDTAGIRAAKSLKSKMDAVARIMALEAIARSHLCIGVLEATSGLVQEDLKVLDAVVSTDRPLCLAINKWDLMSRSVDQKKAGESIGRRAPFLRFASVICVSAKTGFHVPQLLDKLGVLAAEAYKRMPPEQVAHLLDLIRTDPKAPSGVRNSTLHKLTQVSVGPPAFHLVAGSRKPYRSSDVAYLESCIRRVAGFEGVPIRLRFLSKRRKR